MQSLKDILKNVTKEEPKEKDLNQKELFDTKELEKKKFPFSNKAKYISKEYQAYGMRLAGKWGIVKELVCILNGLKKNQGVY